MSERRKRRGKVVAFAALAACCSANAQTYTRTEVTTYHDDLNKWVLGQVKSVTCVAPTECTPTGAPNGIVMSQTDYDSNAMPWKIYEFGVLKQTLLYNTTPGTDQTGTLNKVTDGNSNMTTLTSWYRGVPRSIVFPATPPDQTTAQSKTAVVDDNGWIKSVTDENGYTTSYAYDLMGRMRQITYPSGSTPWNQVVMTFASVPNAEKGLAAGHWKATRVQGRKQTDVYYNAMWQPVLEETYDPLDRANTLTQVSKLYDDNGRLDFQSYPTRALTNYSDVVPGTTTSYDALDRVTSVLQDAETAQPLLTTTEYLSGAGLKTRVTVPGGAQTTISHMAFDQPSYDMAVSIVAPEGQLTEIARDVFGKPKSMRRHNASDSDNLTRSFVYSLDQRLCKSIEPETGATVFGYDGAGNQLWSTAGLSLPSTTSCDTSTAYASSRRVNRTYDQRNRLKTLIFPDSNSNQTWNYTPDGLPAKITTVSVAQDTGQLKEVINTYHYNERRLLIDEKSELAGMFSFVLGYGYDSNGNLSTQIYPDNLFVNFAPNALGQPQSITSTGQNYATGIKYHPNGALKQFTYGNGIVHSMDPNTRLLPERIIDAGVLDFVVYYDKNANVNTIYDQAQGNNFYRAMVYDDLDRLAEAISPSFAGNQHHTYTYDALDNLKTWTNGPTRNDYYNYDIASNRLLTISNGQGGPALQGFGFDVQGNLANKSGVNFTFDYGNRLRQASGTGLLERYRYDGMGRRVFDNRLTGPTGTVGVVYSQYANNGQLLFQQDTAKSKSTDYIYLGGSLLANRDQPFGGSAAITYQHTDPLGTPVATTNAAGVLVERTKYEPYGKVFGGPTKDGPGYTGHVLDTSTGLNYMQQRYYDPAIGRFLSVDPVTANSGTGANFNRYWYAENNPFKFTDPDGREAACISAGSNCGIDQARFSNLLKSTADAIDNVDYIMQAMPGGQLEHAAMLPIIRVAETVKSEIGAANSAVQVVKLEKALASEAQTAKVLAGEGEAIAGAGTSTALKDAERLAAQHGGRAEDWSKVSGGNYVARDGSKVETHAYQNTQFDKIVEAKTKLFDEHPAR